MHDKKPHDVPLAQSAVTPPAARAQVDFVANHLAVDHPWVGKRPNLFVQGSEEELAAESANYFKAGNVVVAHGRDQLFDGCPLQRPAVFAFAVYCRFAASEAHRHRL